MDVAIWSIKSDGVVDRAKCRISPFPVSIRIHTKLLIVDVTEDSAGLGCIGGGLFESQCGGFEDIIVKGSDGYTGSEFSVVGNGCGVAACESIVGRVLVDIGGVENITDGTCIRTDICARHIIIKVT